MKKKLAIVGSGISGMICAYYLKDVYDISIFEKNNYVGGHTHTHQMEENGKQFTLDTGFIVFNLKTYDTLLKLFADLGVKKRKSDMSFGVHNTSINLQYGTTGLPGIFAQRRNLFSAKFWRMIRDIKKFFKYALQDYKQLTGSEETMKEYCQRRGLSKYFMDNYLVPMSSAVWSTSHEKTYDFPIALLLPFFFNHGLLRATKHFQWYTVVGGSNTYTKRIIDQGQFDIHLSEPVLTVEEKGNKVSLKTARKMYSFDKVIMATHSDESRNIVKGMPVAKQKLLRAFNYSDNVAVLHTDSSIMPTKKAAWSSWNHILAKDKQGRMLASTIYWLNRLQNPGLKTNYFLSINPFQKIDKKKTIKTIHYDHPLFTTENFALQKQLQELNKNTNIYFAGAYFRYGFHEDGARAGMRVVELLRGK